jgi:hypothetical protein
MRRFVGGAPLANNIIKCNLRPVNLGDYTVTFTPDEQTRLKAIFSEGVCDYSVPGVEQQNMTGDWQSF